jgi:hypothetical protein
MGGSNKGGAVRPNLGSIYFTKDIDKNREFIEKLIYILL